MQKWLPRGRKNQQALAVQPPIWTLDQWVAAWLADKSNKSHSERTAEAYRVTLLQFRQTLQAAGLDLDGPPSVLAVLAQGWADQNGRGKPSVSNATYNQRLAILSSFYRYVLKRGGTEAIKENPVARMDRRRVEAYAGAAPMQEQTVEEKLRAIDQSTPEGLRDYALLVIAFTTGRRRNELRTLCLGDLHRLANGNLSLHYPRMKGGKTIDDELEAPVTAALLSWLAWLYPSSADWKKDAPVWVALDRNPNHAAARRPLTNPALNAIWKKRIGESKTHIGRHTFAFYMEESGAKVSDIQFRLGHSDLSTTGRYLAKLHQAGNPHAAALVSRFGIGRKKEE